MKKIFNLLKYRLKNAYTDKSGMTLIEIMIVIAIIATISAVIIVPNISKSIDKANYKATTMQISAIQGALVEYYSDNSSYPSTEQGLQALVKASDMDPVPENFKPGGYLNEKSLKDSWKREFIYISPGDNDEPYVIISYGADGKEGGSDFNKDIISGGE